MRTFDGPHPNLGSLGIRSLGNTGNSLMLTLSKDWKLPWHLTESCELNVTASRNSTDNVHKLLDLFC